MCLFLFVEHSLQYVGCQTVFYLFCVFALVHAGAKRYYVTKSVLVSEKKRKRFTLHKVVFGSILLDLNVIIFIVSKQKCPRPMGQGLTQVLRKTLLRGRGRRAVRMSGSRWDPGTKLPSPARLTSSAPPLQTYLEGTSGKPLGIKYFTQNVKLCRFIQSYFISFSRTQFS